MKTDDEGIDDLGYDSNYYGTHDIGEQDMSLLFLY